MKSISMNDSTNEPQTIRTQRSLPYSPNEIFAAFSDPNRLKKWWGPNGFTNTFEFFDFKAGGSWVFVMHAPDGVNYSNECVFKELETGKRIVIEHISQPHFTLTVSLLPGQDCTLVQWVQEFDDPKIAASIRHICEPGNEQNLDRLHKHLLGEF